MSTIVKSIFSSKAYQSFLEAEPQDPQSSGTADAVKCNGIAASGEKDAQTMSPTQDNHYQPTNNASSTRLAAKCHPDADAVCAELDAFFAQNWPWANDRAREEFLKTDCNRWACWALPLARSDRILDTVKVNTLLFLLDDVAEGMSLENGKALYKRLIPIAQGKVQPDRTDPYEWITYDVWASMRAVDEALTEAVLQGALLCVRAQVDDERNRCTGMRALLLQRYKEGGVACVSTFV
ncbi:MAG: hypothetical protein L6R38_004547 [Xanthoria sp. 2 TBL-2021]|nr:MAG: hypothetical protein L6R38_004547 [Xanthoria sp. 2 TBL-2021]